MSIMGRRNAMYFCLIAGATLHGIASANEQSSLSPAEHKAEGRLGRAQAAAMIQSQVSLNAPRLQAKCQQIAEKIVQAAESKIKVRVHIINAPVVNALALSSGDILVYTGLLDELTNSDELAMVLAHEVSHVINHDGVNDVKQAIIKQKRISATTYFLTSIIASAATSAAQMPIAAAGPARSLSGAFAQELASRAVSETVYRASAALSAPVIASIAHGLMRDYGPEVEQQADEEGLELVKKIGMDHQVASAFLQRFRQKLKKANAAKKEQRAETHNDKANRSRHGE